MIILTGVTSKIIIRKLVHALGALILVVRYFWGITAAQIVIGVLAVIYLTSEYFRLSDRSLPVLTWLVTLASQDREKRGVVMTPLWYALGAFTTLSMFPLSQAIVGILTLAVGDPVASLVGLTSENTHKIPFNNDKSYEGSLAGILASWIVCLIFIESRMALIGCTAGMLAEALPLKVNDNVLIPVIAAAAAYGYSLYL